MFVHSFLRSWHFIMQIPLSLCLFLFKRFFRFFLCNAYFFNSNKTFSNKNKVCLFFLLLKSLKCGKQVSNNFYFTLKVSWNFKHFIFTLYIFLLHDSVTIYLLFKLELYSLYLTLKWKQIKLQEIRETAAWLALPYTKNPWRYTKILF